TQVIPTIPEDGYFCSFRHKFASL
ncbi:hypothetical protein CISIN_1g0187181mg, partial [Citrus sinensis]